MSGEIETNNAQICLEDGIVRIRNHEGAKIDLEGAKQNLEAVTALSSGNKVLLWVDSCNVRGMTREARTFFAGVEAATVVEAQAILINSPIGKVVSNFFLGLNKPPFPTRLFTSEEESIAWLRSFEK